MIKIFNKVKCLLRSLLVYRTCKSNFRRLGLNSRMQRELHSLLHLRFMHPLMIVIRDLLEIRSCWQRLKMKYIGGGLTTLIKILQMLQKFQILRPSSQLLDIRWHTEPIKAPRKRTLE